MTRLLERSSQMARYGFIHDKLDIKFLILYFMARFAAQLGGVRHQDEQHLVLHGKIGELYPGTAVGEQYHLLPEPQHRAFYQFRPTGFVGCT